MMIPDDGPGELTEKITREETPSGVVVYREFYDRLGRLVRRDVEHLVSEILMSRSAVDLKPGDT